MPAPSASISALQERIWAGSLPLEIRLATANCRTFDDSESYLINAPRLSYLPFLLPRLHAFFTSSLIDPTVAPHEAWFSFDEVPLKWHYPLGLLYDLFSGAQPASTTEADVHGASSGEYDTENTDTPDQSLPWRLIIHYTSFPEDQLFQLDAEGKVLLDAYINSVKEADYVRNGTAKVVMSLSKDDSSALWRSVETHDLKLFNSVNNKLLNPPGAALRHIPIKVYLPTAPVPASDSASDIPHPGSMRVIQSLVAPLSASRQVVNLGTALNTMLPTVFPSRRSPVLACPVLHGAVVPMSAGIKDLGQAATYADGFLHVAVLMLG